MLHGVCLMAVEKLKEVSESASSHHRSIGICVIDTFLLKTTHGSETCLESLNTLTTRGQLVIVGPSVPKDRGASRHIRAGVEDPRPIDLVTLHFHELPHSTHHGETTASFRFRGPIETGLVLESVGTIATAGRLMSGRG